MAVEDSAAARGRMVQAEAIPVLGLYLSGGSCPSPL